MSIERTEYFHEQNVPIDNNKLEQYNTIIFCDDFNKIVDNIPKNIKNLYFGQYFNQSLDNLHKEIEEISFHCQSVFYKPLDYLSSGLKKLHFGFGYNVPLKLKRILIPIKLPNKIWGRNWMEVSKRYSDISEMYIC